VDNFRKEIMKKNIAVVCSPCGITANYLTCLKRYGQPPIKPCFDVSTFSEGECNLCGHIRPITQVRDFFYPDFSLIIKKIKDKK